MRQLLSPSVERRTVTDVQTAGRWPNFVAELKAESRESNDEGTEKPRLPAPIVSSRELCSLVVDEGPMASVPAAPGDRQQKNTLLVWSEQKRREGSAPYASLKQPELLADCR